MKHQANLKVLLLINIVVSKQCSMFIAINLLALMTKNI